VIADGSRSYTENIHAALKLILKLYHSYSFSKSKSFFLTNSFRINLSSVIKTLLCVQESYNLFG